MAASRQTPVQVLCIDDEPDLGELIKTFLEQETDRIHVHAESSGPDALEFFEANSVDAIVSDFDMPELTGLDVLESVRNVDPDLPFILYTGKGSEEIASKAISHGVTEYMQKETGTDQYAVLANRILNAVDRYRAEQQLEEERTRFQAVFEQASDAMILANDDGTYVDVNSAACDLFDLTETELLGKTAADFTYEEFDFEAAWASFQKVEKERGLFPVERPDGTVRVAEYAASTNILPGMHLSVLRDITEQRESEREIYREKERLDEFAGVLSHDLKNPVQVMKGRLELLATGIDSDQQTDHLNTAMNALGRIEHVIEDVLTISRSNNGVLDTTEVAVSEMAEHVWTQVSKGTASAKIEAGIVVTANESHVERLLTNLFRNTIEHGGDTVAIQVGDLDSGEGFFVEDDGPGIPAEEREEVFDWKHSTKEGGTGIGLKSVAQIIDSEGWNISITEGADGGARFEISDVEIA
ncbi:response regulator [Halorussus salinus]|uniref:response regulator n=1 Tax=Halorussus salinus TaxID=1364935 RepID=UPI00138F7264|nr:response regulator [Halorussus salinus]